MPVLKSQVIHGAKKWQNGLTSRTERLKYLHQTGVLSDVVFVVGKEKIRVKAHKLVLMMSSYVFEDIFESGLGKFSTQSKKIEIAVPDVKPEIFQAMLQFLYRGELLIERDDMDAMLNLLVVAHRYQVEHLQHQCLTIIINGINETNVLSIYHLAHLLKIVDLKQHASDFVCRNASLVLKTNGARSALSLEQLKELLLSDDFNIDEIDLFNFVIEWAKEACKLVNLPPKAPSMKPMVDELVPYIRFGLMEASDVSRHVTSQNIFNDDELVRIYMATTTVHSISTSPNQYGVDCRPRKRYATVSRFNGTATCDGNLTFKTFQSIGRPNWQCISFKVDRAIRMIGVGIFGVSSVVLGELFRFGPDYSYELRILSPQGEILAKQTDTLKYVGEVIHVNLNSPVDIQPDNYYTVAAAVQCVFGKRFVGSGGCPRLEVPWMRKVGNFFFKKTPAIILETKLYGNAKEAELCSSKSTDITVGEIPQIHFTWI